MARTARYLTTAALTAAAMYWFDASSGRRRRARLRDRVVSSGARLSHGVGVAGRDLGHRLNGAAARLGMRFRQDGHVQDQILVERVRAALGRAVSHPGAVRVEAHEGRIVLSGTVLAWEHEPLLNLARHVRGVRDVESRLAVYERANGVPALQGGRARRQPPRFELLQENWSPAARLLAGAAGGLLLLLGARRRGLGGAIEATAGSLLIARSTTNAPLRRLAGAGARRAVDIRKTLHVNAPLERVFEALSRYENFPAFMHNVRSVEVLENGRSRWTVAGPAGVPLHWESETTACEPNRLLAWRTVGNSSVGHAGVIRFEPAEGGTRLTIQMSYNPPAGALGHVVARLLGADAKSELDQDLVRLKSFLETGRRARDAAAPGSADTRPASQLSNPSETAVSSPLTP